jgi:hypothetical protein
MKKSAKCWNSSNILLTRTSVYSPAFLEPSLAEKIAFCAHTSTTRLRKSSRIRGIFA